MKINNIDEVIKNNNYPPVLLIFGEEEYLIEESVNKIKSELQKKDSTSFDLELLNGEKTTFKEIVEKCLTFPFVSERRTVIVNNFELLPELTKTKKERINLPFKNYLENPQSSTFLLIISRDLSLSSSAISKSNQKSVKNQKRQPSLIFPYDLIFEKHQWVEFKKFKDNDYINWITNKLESQKKKVSQNAAQILFSSFNPNLREIDGELDKLLLYSKNKDYITEDDIAQLIGQSKKYNVFELQKAVGKRNLNLSIEILTNLLANERQEMLILTVLTRYFVVLWKLYDLNLSNTTNAEMAAKVGVNPYFLREYLEALKKYRIKEVEKAIVILNEIDEKLKSTSIDTLYLLQSLLFRIMEDS